MISIKKFRPDEKTTATVTKSFWGYFIQYILFIGVSIWLFIFKLKKGNIARWLIGLYWVNIVIGILQYPLPFIGNGRMDTTKQLFLFVMSYDITIVTTFIFITYCAYKLILKTRLKKNENLMLTTA